MSKVVFTKRDIDDLLVLIHHVCRDISYGGEGSYVKDVGGDNVFDGMDAKKAQRAIEVLKRLLLVGR